MPNITAKVDWFFQDRAPEPAGWTETAYLIDTDIQQALADAMSDAYVVPRLNLLHSAYFLREVRVSDVNVLRDSQVGVFPGNSGQGLYPIGRGAGNTDVNEEPYDGLLIRMEAGTNHRRMFIMRGLPSNVVTRERGYHPEPDWLNLFPLWSGAVTIGVRWQLRLLTFNAVAMPDSVVVMADNRSLALTWTGGVPAGIAGPTPGQAASIIKIQGEHGAYPTNKQWTVRRVVGNTVYTRPGLRRIIGTPALPFFVSLGVVSYGGITNVVPLEGRSRKTGRPSDELRGRRSVQRN